MFHEYTPCRPRTNRLSSTGLDQSAAVRKDRGCSKRRSNAYTLGETFEKMLPLLPSVHAPGTAAGSPEYEAQLGIGAVGPMQVIVRVDVGRPVCATASFNRFADPTFWKMPATCLLYTSDAADERSSV